MELKWCEHDTYAAVCKCRSLLPCCVHYFFQCSVLRWALPSFSLSFPSLLLALTNILARASFPLCFLLPHLLSFPYNMPLTPTRSAITRALTAEQAVLSAEHALGQLRGKVRVLELRQEANQSARARLCAGASSLSLSALGLGPESAEGRERQDEKGGPEQVG